MGKIIKRIIACSDFHVPYYSERAVVALLNVLAHYHVDLLIICGDFLDMYGVSKYIKLKTSWEDQLQYEFDSGKGLLKRIREVYKGRIIYIEGNHEFRLTKYLATDGKALSTLRCLTIQQQLNLDELGVEYVDSIDGNGLYYFMDNLLFNHGKVVRKHSSFSAKAAFEDQPINQVMGHTHRIGCFYKTVRGKTAKSWEIGCMCDLDESFIANPNWQNGFLEIYLDETYPIMIPREVNYGK